MKREWEGEEYEDSLTVIIEEMISDSDQWFPRELVDSLPHHILATCGEAGELANVMKKIQRGSLQMDTETRFTLVMEATDVFIYLMHIFACLQYHPAYAYKIKREYNAIRFGTDGGSPSGVDEQV